MKLVVLTGAGDGHGLCVNPTQIAWFEEHYHKEHCQPGGKPGPSEYTDHGTLRINRTQLRIDGEHLMVMESPCEVALLLRGWSHTDPRLWALRRIDAEGGPTSAEYYEFMRPETSKARLTKLLTEIDLRCCEWCAKHSDRPDLAPKPSPVGATG